MKGKQGVMNACEYSILELQKIKKEMMNTDNPNKELVWAVGGIIICLSSNLLRITTEVIQGSIKNDEPNAENDLKEIQVKFNEFMNGMIDHE